MNVVKRTESSWPEEDLERVEVCPVCDSSEREILYEELTDRVFFCAPGVWRLYRCGACKSAYLDPRPTASSIGRAYSKYFTHAGEPKYAELKAFERLRRRVANGYRNWAYGTTDVPATVLGVLAAYALPGRRAIIDAGMRHLPRARPGMALLDIGCGNGGFLARARSAGWQVAGLDFDKQAVAVAREKGLDVRFEDIERYADTGNRFDVITLSHLIEHVPHPVRVLEACHSMLRPDGSLWLETPNLEAQGRHLYGTDWLGLDSPRHLVLFTLESIRYALRRTGFNRIETQSYRPLCGEMFRASAAISLGMDPYVHDSGVHVPGKVLRRCERRARRDPGLREHITVKAWKN